ncbi:GNAT family N-acetyltransferase [Streptococcus pseudoporcinus]|uniref:Acetyltransferase, GNAT family n=1 Tax=Streptococcus pseudoporcinus LQ 940-04 TaxID=875093 RepID=G5K6M2_9STRE|nr:GNAT family N-acetyltransferase [Streptococcus pseudoporcinus]EFR44226.1 acetyltransferase, GNAT family [Streptococcus pseudoporcinus SPIN 20026]EHI65956.1 acetyltransferase, GNAT family [Streptococcus pseudoporcinus LQ 940-04]VEF94575.1 acetyltransferase, GNAT family [Streptococcus pseudoporcinus]
MWMIKSFKELSREQLFAILKARVDVFVVEQDCAYPEIDDLDKTAIHLFKIDGFEQVIAYCRLIPTKSEIKLGRVLVGKSYRKSGLGRDLVSYALSYCAKEYTMKPVYAQAQAYLEKFYNSFGFYSTSEVYLEDKIPHIDMIKID